VVGHKKVSRRQALSRHETGEAASACDALRSKRIVSWKRNPPTRSEVLFLPGYLTEKSVAQLRLYKKIRPNSPGIEALEKKQK